MRKIFALVCVLCCSRIYGQRFEYVFRDASDSTYNCYLKIIPESMPIKGLVVRDYSTLPDVNAPSPFRFPALCTEAGLMTIYTVSSNHFPEFFISEGPITVLDEIVTEVVKEHHIPLNNIFIGGISASGTRALRYAQFCAQGKSVYGIGINGVFAVDSPLDLARFHKSVHDHINNFKEGMLWEADLMKEVFWTSFSGPPDVFAEEYKWASVFSHTDLLGGNLQYLSKTDVIFYHEPDIDWWLSERGATYLDINSYDIVSCVLKLRSLGNPNIELVTTTNKGYDKDGSRNCHSWSIVDEEYLTQWIVRQLE